MSTNNNVSSIQSRGVIFYRNCFSGIERRVLLQKLQITLALKVYNPAHLNSFTCKPEQAREKIKDLLFYFKYDI